MCPVQPFLQYLYNKSHSNKWIQLHSPKPSVQSQYTVKLCLCLTYMLCCVLCLEALWIWVPCVRRQNICILTAVLHRFRQDGTPALSLSLHRMSLCACVHAFLGHLTLYDGTRFILGWNYSGFTNWKRGFLMLSSTNSLCSENMMDLNENSKTGCFKVAQWNSCS